MTEPQSQYDPGFAAFGGGSTHSVLHPVVLAALIVITLLTFLLPRKYVIVPLLLGILVTPYGQNIYVGGIHLFVHRILILVGWSRLLSSRFSSSRSLLAGGFSTLDKLFVVWAIYRALAVVILFWRAGAVVSEVAFLIDAVGGYFLFRSLVREGKDVERVVKVFVVIAFVSALGMVRELLAGQNIFALVGGLPPPVFRNGHIRAQAAFAISIAAGAFGATTFPLCLWLYKRGKARIAAAVGAVSSVVMIFACMSSTPITAFLGSILAVCLWPWRKRMRLVRWGIVLVLVALQLVMKSPVWFLMSHIDPVDGSGGWNRAKLVDMFIKHVGDWWLIGTHDNVNWGWDMWDQCNQFVMEGETGGLIALACFIAMIAICFKNIGTARRAVEGDHKKEWLCWLLGAALFAQVMVFIGLDYFDQSKFVWYALLAIIPAATMTARTTTARESQRALVPDPIPVMSTSESTSAMPNGRHLARPTISTSLFQ